MEILLISLSLLLDQVEVGSGQQDWTDDKVGGPLRNDGQLWMNKVQYMVRFSLEMHLSILDTIPLLDDLEIPVRLQRTEETGGNP